MSDHTWTLNNIAAYVASGLDPEEAERLEQHAATCPECTAELRRAQALHQRLDALFSAARPGAALEERAIQALRNDSARADVRARSWRRMAWGAAAAVVLGATGAAMSQLVPEAALPFPGVPRSPMSADADEMPTHMTRSRNGLFNSDNGQSFDAALITDRTERAQSAISPSQGIRDPEEMARDIANQSRFAKDKNPVTQGGMPAGAPSFPQSAGFVSDVSRSDKSIKAGDQFLGGQYLFEEDHFKPDELVSKPAAPAEPKPKDDGKPQPKSDPVLHDPEKFDPEAPTPAKPDNPAPETAVTRKVIRSGEIEFEIDSFDSALAAVTKLVTGIKGAFVATVNSDKLVNGKMKGSIVVRLPPDNLDPLILDLRKELGKFGELKGQRIKSDDITKQYTDMESRLKAARTMEQRLLGIIKEGKGEIKQLLDAEKELGNWRTKIEEYEGEMRYYANRVALSTLTITLTEKEIRSAADVVERENVQAGIEVEDVDKAMRNALAAVIEAKGRVSKSEMKQHSAGQFSAILHFEVAPEAAGPLRDRLKQLGNLARLEIDRTQQAEGGSSPAPRDAKVRRGDTRFEVSLYNLTKVEARETATVRVAVVDVPAGYRTMRNAIEQAKGRVVSAQLNEQDRQNPSAELEFEVPRSGEDDIQKALAAAGDVVSRNVNRVQQTTSMTDAKVLYKTTLVAAAGIAPRETEILGIEVADVDATMAVFNAEVAQTQGRALDPKVSRERSGRVTALLSYDVPLSAASALVEKFKSTGTVRAHQSSRDPKSPEGKLARARIDVTLSNSDLIFPKDDGLWPTIRTGLSYSVTFLLKSVSWLVFGLCVVLPWALVGYGVYRVGRRLFGSPPTSPAPPAPTA